MLLQSAVLAALLAGWVTWRQAHPPLPAEVRPLKAPKMKALAEFDESYRSSMLWGSYRSGLYFGMRTR
jgi:mannosyl-oligosaccharide glucosidase